MIFDIKAGTKDHMADVIKLQNDGEHTKKNLTQEINNAIIKACYLEQQKLCFSYFLFTLKHWHILQSGTIYKYKIKPELTFKIKT